MNFEEKEKRRTRTAARIGLDRLDPCITDTLLDTLGDTIGYINLFGAKGNIKEVFFLEHILAFSTSERRGYPLWDITKFFTQVNEFSRHMCKGPMVITPLTEEMIH